MFDNLKAVVFAKRETTSRIIDLEEDFINRQQVECALYILHVVLQ